MTSSKLSIDKRRRTYVRLIGEIQHELHQALDEEHQARGLTQQGMADALETSKSFVSRKMNGTSNMTLETLSDLGFALNRAVKVSLRPRHEAGSNWFSKISSTSSPTSDQSAEIRIRPERHDLEVADLEPMS